MSISPRKSLLNNSNLKISNRSSLSGLALTNIEAKLKNFKFNPPSTNSSQFNINSPTVTAVREEEQNTIEQMKIELKMNEMYENSNWKDYNDINNSESIGIEIMQKIIQKGGDMLYDNYLNQKQNKHVFESIMYLSELSWQQERIIHDLDFDLQKQNNYFYYPKNEYSMYVDQLLEDQEPQQPGRENRRNYNVEVEKKIVIESEQQQEQFDDSMDIARNQIIDQLMDQSNSAVKRKKKRNLSNYQASHNINSGQLVESNRQFTPHSAFQSMKLVQSCNIDQSELDQNNIDRDQEIIDGYNQVTFEKHEIKFINIDEYQDIDRVEEQLRLLKQRELELKQQKEEFEQLRLIEQKEQQQRLRDLKKGENNSNEKKQIAYDYNGQIFKMNPIKSDKFPNSTVVVNHNISKGEISQIDYNKQAKAAQKAIKKKQIQSKQQQQIVTDFDDNSSVDKQSNHSDKQFIRKKQNTIQSNQAYSSYQKNNNNNNNINQAILINENKKSSFNFNKKDGTQTQREPIFYSNQEVFEIFKANKGVTLIEGGRVKKGPNFNNLANSVDLSRMGEKHYGKEIHITKNVYNSLVGNLINNLSSDQSNNNLLQNSFISSSALQFNNNNNNSNVIKTEPFDMRIPLHLINSLPQQNNLDGKQNKIQMMKSQSQNISNDNNRILDSYLDQNNSSLIGSLQTPNKNNSSLISNNNNNNSNLNNSSFNRKKNFFNSQQKLQPIDNNKISVSSMEILQTLALDDHDYVIKVLNKNPATDKKRFSKQHMITHSQSEQNIFQNKTNQNNNNQKEQLLFQKQKSNISEKESHPNSASSSSNNQSQHKNKSYENNNNNNNNSLNLSLNNMSAISHTQQQQQQNQHKKSYLQNKNIIPITMPTDEYNRIIITGGMDWGNPIIDSVRKNFDQNQSPSIKVDDSFKLKHTIGQHGKFPRDRLMKKSLQEMSHLHLSPPEIGKTMGYGAGQGYHPDQLVSFKQLQQEQQLLQQQQILLQNSMTQQQNNSINNNLHTPKNIHNS